MPPAAPDFAFQWHLSDRCHRRCAHCYQDSHDGGSEPGPEAHAEMADRVLSALPGRAVRVHLTGGEPLLLPWLAELGEHLHGRDNLAELGLITSGTLAPRRLLTRLAALPGLRRIQVSVESGSAAVHDAVRGAGSLARVVRLLPRFRDLTGRPLVLMVTLGRHNVGTIDGTVRLAERVGAAGIVFERFVPLGRGRGMAGEALDATGWRAAQAAIVRASGVEGLDPDDLLPYRALRLWLAPGHGESLEGALCNLGGSTMALMPDGTVLPCRRLPLPLGNVLRTPFADLLERLRSHAPEALRPRLSGLRCRGCGVEDCMGCRALALAVAGDLLADDPQCSRPPAVPPGRSG